MTRRRCSVAGCTRSHVAKGYCGPHGRRVEKYGDPRLDVPIRIGSQAQLAAADGYTAGDVCAMTGATYRKLDYWTETGLIRASVRDDGDSGNPRVYSTADVGQVADVVILLDVGFSLHAIRRFSVDQRRRLLDAVLPIVHEDMRGGASSTSEGEAGVFRRSHRQLTRGTR